MIKVFQVGGSVRDMMLGVLSKDIDYAVEASSYEDMRTYILSRTDSKIYLETPQYFTIRAHVDKLGDADFVLCRKDGIYSDARRPDTVEVGTIFDDLSRRDFTMNAIAINMDNGELLDPYKGQNDIDSGIIRCVRKAKDRFEEDALRMLRALRFAITKNMTLDIDIMAALGDSHLLGLLKNSISQDRKKDELMKMFKKDTFKTLELLRFYPEIKKVLFEDQPLWLEPTLKEQ
jgi:tRNA nucleotidyltransferase (CCA-adding enzyme)